MTLNRRVLAAGSIVVLGIVLGAISTRPEADRPIESAPPASRVILESVTARSPSSLLAVGATSETGGRLVVIRSEDGGQSWATQTLDMVPFSAVSWTGGRLLASTACELSPSVTATPSCLFASDDWGETWVDLHAGMLVRPSFATPNEGWAAKPQAAGDSNVYGTADAGRTWVKTTYACPSETPVVAAISNTSPAAGFLLCYAQLPSTSALAIPWSLLSISPAGAVVRQRGASSQGAATGFADDFFRGIAMLPDGRGLLWANEALYRTTDGGTTWAAVSVIGAGTFWGPGAVLADGHAYLVRRDTGSFTAIYGTADLRDWRRLVSFPFFG
jgi:photosystem II stability/assembly factor-like uncharacterized protein